MIMDIPSIGNPPQSGQLISDKTAVTNVRSAPPANNISAPTATAADNSENKKFDSTEVNKAIAHINDALQARSQDLRFSVDTDSKRVVVKIIDQQTNQVLRQIPTEEALEISKSLDKLKGLLIKNEA
ncbi:flagellar protein FlaG [Undibacterium sp. CY21W]|jgi:flagellar protein FlaG|uniref:Flagellar protein FlaG n=2 Tax=Oxalobacteraceae TaxID=75682 RepID=A0ABR6XE29_9BURK|nr:flagellar protein FlaG [Undibacterium aquatile]MBC3929722.1 flagellar protein FlaG [Undibacterium sp. CY21W]